MKYPSCPMIGLCGLFFGLVAIGLSAGAATLSTEAHGDGGLCRRLVVDEAQLEQHLARDIFNDAPLGSQVVSLRPVGGALGGFTPIEPPPQFENGWVEIASIPATTGAAPKTLYHIAGGSHYFDGDLYVITGAEVARDDVLTMVWNALSPSGGVESIVEKAKAAGWVTISGAGAPYRATRYTHIWAFLDNGQLYFLAQGPTELLRSKRGRKLPAFILLRPDPNGSFATLCLYKSTGPHL